MAGLAELCLAESDGTLVSIVEKVPVIDQGDRLVPGAKLPVSVDIPYLVLDRVVNYGGGRSALIRLCSDIEDQKGRTILNVVDEGRLAQRS